MILCAVALIVLVATALGSLAGGRRATDVAVVGAVAAAALALPPALGVLAGGPNADLDLAWAPPLDHVRLGLDPLTAFFVVPLVVLGALCAIYGASYLDDRSGRRWLGPPACAGNLLIAAMLLVLLARNAIVFVIGWEVMTITSYLLITFDHHDPEVRRAGWVYLIAAHIGVACVLAMFLLLAGGTGDLEFAALTATPAHGAVAVVAGVLGLIGFGLKAGIVPLHVWLPEAHAAAPSHVSALMSGMLIKLGIYGLLRTLTFIPASPAWGAILAGLGLVSALVGISLSLYQRDLKRALAYSSIENVGIILLGLGVAVWSAARGEPAIAALAVFGGLLHLWNHAAMKGLLFLGAGSLLHETGTRDLERMGGLLGRMPSTGGLMIVGATAIAGLPPLAGFASEWLTYRGLIAGGVGARAGEGMIMLFAVAALAAVGVLAALGFVRIVGVALLGQPRSEAAATAHESSPGLVAPMAVLAAATIAAPLAAPWLVGALAPVADQITGMHLAHDAVARALVPVAILNAVVWLAILAAIATLRWLTRRRRADDTWGCGYPAPTARMQYTGASLSDTIEDLLPGRLRPRVAVRRESTLFPPPGGLVADRRDPFTRAAYEPLLDRLSRRFAQLRWVQQGVLQLYILYILVAVVGALAVVSLGDWWGRT